MVYSMTSQHAALDKIRQYAGKVNDEGDIKPIQPDEEEAYANQLQRSLQSLQKQVREHEANLGKVRDIVHTCLSWFELI